MRLFTHNVSRLALTVAAALCVPAAVIGSAIPASASGGTEHNGSDLKCLDAESHNLGSNSDKVQLWGCLGTSNQQWAWNCSSSFGFGCEIVNQADGKCLDADANNIGANGDTVQLWDCWGGANQLWYIADPSVNKIGYTQVVNVADGKCLDGDTSNITRDGDKVQLWDCWYTGTVS
jgi:hypothetical protein